ncbi:arabinofuranosidase catalytic domain-containing protein [Catenulispora pinisilvae]|uniref:arabinofuranosidase catalytic domain-containing protein n=1 Tax=Catenulispora pinisilvae TaxID=2705253 RepID=UPI001890FB41|nr:arabinofuranosidase catalytic domain-containing protein [Catenulispora pinisilvae]
MRKTWLSVGASLTLALAGLGLMGGTARAATQGPCDIYAAGSTPCVAAHSTTRALYGAYSGNLYQVRRSSDNTTANIGVTSAGGYADAAAQDSFCAGTTCVITVIYDQSGRGNNLTQALGGGAAPGADNLAVATAAPTTLNGHKAYGVFIPAGTGYRDDSTNGIATGDNAEGEYAIFDGSHYNGGCCFDYGNAETNNNDDGNGTMEAIYFGNIKVWGYGSGNGPWIMADMENGLYSGQNAGYNANDPSISDRYTTAIIKGTANQWAIRGGNAQSGSLSTFYSGPRPNVSGYNPMRKQGAIILGTGGDNSRGSDGTFYEGVMTSGYPSDATENAVQANIVAAGYGSTPPVTYPSLAASFNDVGITSDTNTGPGDFDGNGYSFSATALSNAKAAPGASITSSGVTFAFPNVAAGVADNTVAENQIITMSGSGTLGFLLDSSYGPTSGTGTITYTDGSTQSYTLSSADWWSTTPASGSALAVSSAYQNRQGNTTATQSSNIFSETVPLAAGKTLASVQLPTGNPPASGSAALHIFALATSGSGTGGNTVTVAGPGNQSGMVGTAVNGLQIQGTDSAAGQTLTYSASGLPTGLSISGGGLIAGTPTTAGTSTVTVTATDGTGATGSATFTWTVTGTTTGPCHVDYTKTNEWPGGFTANVTITNTGTTPINGWTAAWTFPGDQKITNAWSATTTQSGAAASATNAAYNGSISPGADTSFGFQGTFTANDTSPSSFTVNGAMCS